LAQNRTWIVVADGTQARILLNTGRMLGVRQVPGGHFQELIPPGREIMTDRQPRVQESVGSARHAVEPRIDPRAERKRQFVEHLAEHLEKADRRGEFENLVIVAPPHALGDLRHALTPALRKRVIAEFAHDYTHQDNDIVYQHVQQSLPL
jgi:protein required for attachment to host cells